jgi:CheY-like chemotaxis protein
MESANTSSPIPCVLVAEDHEDDVFFLRRAFEKAAVPCYLVVARDGQETVDYLGGYPPYTDRAVHPFPNLLLLDLRMPRMNGFDVLAWLRARPQFKDLPVILFTTSDMDLDLHRAQALGVSEYCVKPPSSEQLIQLVKDLAGRWLGDPAPPSQKSPGQYGV